MGRKSRCFLDGNKKEKSKFGSHNYLLDYCVVFYLIAPLLFFFIGMAKLVYAIPACCIFVYYFISLYRATGFSRPIFNSSQLAVLLIAGILTAFVGLFPGLNHMSGDWYKHFALFNLLRDYPWPPSLADSTVLLIKGYLRYYLGYYIVPGAISALFPSVPIRVFIFIWTIFGVYIGLLYLIKRKKSLLNNLCVVLCFVFFSGFDVLGYFCLSKNWVIPNQIEWWAGAHLFQYSSFITGLIWVPQHLLPALTLTMLTTNTERFKSFVPYLGLLFCGAFFYSPFAAIGILPIWLTMLWITYKLNGTSIFTLLKDVFSLPNILSLGIAIPLWLYLHTDTSSIPMMFAWHYHGNWAGTGFTWDRYLLFLTVEVFLWVIIATLSLKLEKVDKILLLAITTILTLIPLIRIGYANDWTMRASLPSLILLASIIARGVGTAKGLRRGGLLFAVIFGAITPYLEIKQNLAGFSVLFNEPELVDISNAIKENSRVEKYVHHQLLSTVRPIIMKASDYTSSLHSLNPNQQIVWEKTSLRQVLLPRYGWSAESWGGWTIDKHAKLIFPFIVSKNTSYLLTLYTSGFIFNQDQAVDVFLNKKYIHTWYYTKESKERKEQFLIQDMNNIQFDFNINHPTKASAQDSRLLSMAVSKVILHRLFSVTANVKNKFKNKEKLSQILFDECGWSIELGSAWSDTNKATMLLSLPSQHFSSSEILSIKWNSHAFLSNKKTQIVDVIVNGRFLKSLVYLDENQRQEELIIHPNSNIVKIEFYIHEPVCPKNDWRCLGIHLSDLSIELKSH